MKEYSNQIKAILDDLQRQKECGMLLQSDQHHQESLLNTQQELEKQIEQIEKMHKLAYMSHGFKSISPNDSFRKPFID